jgi:hypothetical protein
MKTQIAHPAARLTTDATDWLRKSSGLVAQQNRNVALALIALLSVTLPVAAEQFSGQTRAGILTRVATVNPLQASVVRGAALAAPALAHPRGARRLQPKISASVAAQFSPALTAAPAAAAPTRDAQMWSAALLDSAHSDVIGSNFDGVSSLDSAVTNFGAEFEPPDQGLCVGNGFVVEPVNSAYTVYKRDGTPVAGPFNVNVLFAEGLTEFTSDPRCHFDPTTNTWFATILFISADNTKARTDIAVNASGDPTTPWTVYHLDGTDDGTDGTPAHVGCPCFGDQPLLGIDGDNIYIATNEFSILGPQANGAQIYAVSKRDLINGAANVHFVQFENLMIAGNIAFAVQPALTSPGQGDSGGVEYFLESVDPTQTSDNRLGVWALTHPGAVSEGEIPTLSSIVISSLGFGIPPPAVQQGSTSLLDTGDDRMQQAQFIDGRLWGALTTALDVSGNSTQLSAIAWFEVHPEIRDAQIASASVTNQGILASPGNFLFYPALQVTPNGAAAMVFTISGPTLFGSAAFARMSAGRHSFGPPIIAALGSGPYAPSSTRWGDYSWAVADPNGQSVWLATEYIPPLDRQTVDGLQNWGTRVLEIRTAGAE